MLPPLSVLVSLLNSIRKIVSGAFQRRSRGVLGHTVGFKRFNMSFKVVQKRFKRRFRALLRPF